MPEFLLNRGHLRIGTFARFVLLVIAACVVGAMVGRIAVSHYGQTAIEALIAIPLLIYIAPRPLVGTLVVLMMLGSIFTYSVMPRVNLPGHPPINIADAVLFVVVGGTIWRRPWRTWPDAVQKYTLLLALLLGFAMISTVEIASHGHAAFREALVGIRNLLFLALPITIAVELRGRLWRPLLDTAIALAAIVSVLSIAAAASHSVYHVIANLNPLAVASFNSGASTSSRIRLPGLFLAYAMLLPTLVIALTVHDRWRRWRIFALALIVGAIAVSLNRNMYFGGAIGLAVTLMLGGPRLRHRTLLSLVIVVAVAVLVVESVKPTAISEIQQRAGSALSSNVLSSGSAQARALEYQFAWQSIKAHPIDGIGWMQSYGLTVLTGPRVFVEDLYLHLATDYGIPAALTFLLLPFFLIGYGARRLATAADPLDKALLAAAIGSVVALLLSCLVGTYVQTPDSTASFAFGLGLLLAAAVRATPGGSGEAAPPSTDAETALTAA